MTEIGKLASDGTIVLNGDLPKAQNTNPYKNDFQPNPCPRAGICEGYEDPSTRHTICDIITNHKTCLTLIKENYPIN
jgi:hypothetical protein